MREVTLGEISSRANYLCKGMKIAKYMVYLSVSNSVGCGHRWRVNQDMEFRFCSAGVVQRLEIL